VNWSAGIPSGWSHRFIQKVPHDDVSAAGNEEQAGTENPLMGSSAAAIAYGIGYWLHALYGGAGV
jgi:hypothetical protein